MGHASAFVPSSFAFPRGVLLLGVVLVFVKMSLLFSFDRTPVYVEETNLQKVSMILKKVSLSSAVKNKIKGRQSQF